MPEAESKTRDSAIDAYKARIASYVKEGEDPVALQRRAPDTLAELLANCPTEKVSLAPAPGKWSVASILAHLAEAECVSTWRYRQMLENNGATLVPFDQDQWAELGDYGRRDALESLALFRLLRKANLEMFKRLTPEQWQQHGVHLERGRMTVESLVRQMAGHDLNHIEQIRKIIGR